MKQIICKTCKKAVRYVRSDEGRPYLECNCSRYDMWYEGDKPFGWR